MSNLRHNEWETFVWFMAYREAVLELSPHLSAKCIAIAQDIIRERQDELKRTRSGEKVALAEAARILSLLRQLG